jgi:excisionase family DNA binding protein
MSSIPTTNVSDCPKKSTKRGRPALPTGPAYISVDEAGAMASVSRWTARRWCSTGGFTVVRIGRGGIRIHKAEFEAWLREHSLDGKTQ